MDTGSLLSSLFFWCNECSSVFSVQCRTRNDWIAFRTCFTISCVANKHFHPWIQLAQITNVAKEKNSLENMSPLWNEHPHSWCQHEADKYWTQGLRTQPNYSTSYFCMIGRSVYAKCKVAFGLFTDVQLVLTRCSFLAFASAPCLQ